MLNFSGFPSPSYVIPPPVAFSMNPGFTFSTGMSVSGPFLQPVAHPQQPGAQQVKGDILLNSKGKIPRHRLILILDSKAFSLENL